MPVKKLPPAAKKVAPTKATVKPTAKTVIPIKPLTSWSFSRLSDYDTCPRKFKIKHLQRIKEPGSPAMDRGNMLHAQAEKYIKGQLPKLHPELVKLKDELTKLRAMYKAKKLPMVVEDNWAFTADWEETAWDDWALCWLRVKLDCAHYEEQDGWMVMPVTDWKSGTPNDYKKAEYMEQLDLYALVGLLMSQFEDVIIRPRLGWIDTGDFFEGDGDTAVQYTREDIPRLKKYWEGRVKKMFADKTFAPKPNRLCGWCFYGQAGLKKGGPGLCEY